jgi:hypothetical protein
LIIDLLPHTIHDPHHGTAVTSDTAPAASLRGPGERGARTFRMPKYTVMAEAMLADT